MSAAKLAERIVLTAGLIFFGCFVGFGQSRLSGFVYDRSTNTPVPFANVMVMGTNKGAATDTLGYFSFSYTTASDSMRISNLGYQPRIFKIGQQPDTIYLQSVARELGVFEVRPGENPAFAVLDRVVEQKPKNRTQFQQPTRFEEYQKIRFDLNHFTDKIKKNFLLKPFDYLWQNEGVDSNGVRFLPALLVEKYIEHFRHGKDEKAIVSGEKITGLAGPRLMEFVSDLYIVPEVYDNFIPIFEKNFPSPIHDDYQRYYKYYLMDSMEVNGRKTYLITYKPKFVSQRAFSGVMKIDSISSAVLNLSMRFDLQANVNFVRSYLIRQSYRQLPEGYWVVDSSGVLGDFTVVENASDLTGFFGRKISVFDSYQINTAVDQSVFSGPLKTVVADSAGLRSEQYWREKRKVGLRVEDQGIEDITERLRSDPRFIFRKNLLISVGSGYVPAGPFDIGDIYTFYSYNQVEYGRFKLGGRHQYTAERPVEFAGYGAYGLRDARWKYAASGFYRRDFDRNKKLWVGGSYKNDIEQLGRSFNLIKIDHLFASLRQFEADDSRYYVQRSRGFVGLQPGVGITFLADYQHEQFETVFLSENGEVTSASQFYTSGSIGVTAKLSWLNTDMSPFYDDASTLKKRFVNLPDVYLSARYGGRSIGSDADYWQGKATIQQFLPFGNWGYFHYRLEGAKTWGDMPYIFAEVPAANATIFNDVLSMNLMNFMEFYADEWAMISLSHHFDGWVFDRIPLVKKLKLRSFIFAKTLIGSANRSNPFLIDLPLRTAFLEQPYYEWGFGIENIIKFARIDFVWRYTDNPSFQEYYYFMIKPSFQFQF